MPARRHGLSKSKIYGVWAQIINRCRRATVKEYKYYGARGITVCDRWLTFDNFYADMGDCPSGCSIERIYNDGPYSPQNCRWATRQEQAQNKRNSRLLTHNGRTQTMAELARELGITPAAVFRRLQAWPIEQALTIAKPERPNAKLNMRQAREIRAAYPKLNSVQLAAKYSVSNKTIWNVIYGKNFVDTA
jgi:hypothetical protein